MRRTGRRWAVAVGGVLALVVTATVPAGAKGLPIASVSVSTTTPTAGKPFTVTVRFLPGQDFGDYGWENEEVTVLPATRADARGWPLSFEDRGRAIPIHRVGFGVFRGTAVVRTPGDYVVVDGSAVIERIDRAQGIVNVRGPYAFPVRIRVVRASSGSSFPWAPVGLGAAAVVGLLAITRARRMRGRAIEDEPEELVSAAR
jgi:hypothetical protein